MPTCAESAVTSGQRWPRRMLARWQRGIPTRAELDKMFYRGSIHHNIRRQIERYGRDFGRVLSDEVEFPDPDDPADTKALRYDLYGLMKSGCPAVGLVELMLACTSDYGVTIPDLLFRAIPLHDYLDRIAEDIHHFRIPRRPRRFKGAVPHSIQFMLEVGPYYASYTKGNSGQTARVAFHLAYFYTFLKHFRYRHKT